MPAPPRSLSAATGSSAAAAAAAIAVALLLVACTAGPDYVRPTLDLPTGAQDAYKEAGTWKTAEPRPAGSHEPWWQAYADPALDGLMQDAERANQNLRVAEAQYRQAQALADQARAALYPTVGANLGAQRTRTGVNTGGTNNANSANSATSGGRVVGIETAGLSASWVPDLWGSVRRSIEAGEANAAASADDLAGVHLSIQAALAQNYLQLRTIDQLRDLYVATTEAYARALKLTQAQRAAGVAFASDVALAQSQLAAAQAQATDLDASRALLEHAIAILTGRTPSQFALAPLAPRARPAAPLAPSASASTAASTSASASGAGTGASAMPLFAVALPAAPVGLPSELLERRPDIAAAERRAALANANIGVARAAYYPSLVLSATGGFSAAGLGSLFDTPGRVWSLGAALAGTLFDGGLRRARDAQAVAAYDAAAAQYKQTVLTGFQQVEDNLATLRVLDREADYQAQAVTAGQTAERLALSQYRAGTATYLAVVTAQTLSLVNQRTAVQLRGRQLAASVALITATGGGWRADGGAPLAANPAPMPR